MAQIDMLRTHFVDDLQWITRTRFNRVLAVYQALPGPEATELGTFNVSFRTTPHPSACYFGMLSRGRPGAVLAGIGFLLPGFLMMLLLSYLYTIIGFNSPAVRASFNALQTVVAAMVHLDFFSSYYIFISFTGRPCCSSNR